MTTSRIRARTAVVAAVSLFVGLPLLAQPLRPAIVALPLPEPTLWQSAALFIGQFLIFGLVVWVWNQRQRLKERERELEHAKLHTSGVADE
jgi:hypothetical protein